MPDEFDHNDSGEKKVRAVTFGLGVAALAGLVVTTGAGAAGASAAGAGAAADHARPVAIAAPATQLFDWWHLTCSGQD